MAPELRDLVHREGLDPATLHIGMPVDDLGHFLHRTDRRQIMVSDNAAKKGAIWTPTSLRALFRGEKSPPDLSRYPKEYVPHFYAIEFFVAMLFKLDRPRSDQEMEEVYASMRRRPDGKSLGETHDWIWAVAAFFLGRFEVSQAEFEAIFQQLSVSTRRFSMSSQSYNYAEYIRQFIKD